MNGIPALQKGFEHSYLVGRTEYIHNIRLKEILILLHKTNLLKTTTGNFSNS